MFPKVSFGVGCVGDSGARRRASWLESGGCFLLLLPMLWDAVDHITTRSINGITNGSATAAAVFLHASLCSCTLCACCRLDQPHDQRMNTSKSIGRMRRTAERLNTTTTAAVDTNMYSKDADLCCYLHHNSCPRTMCASENASLTATHPWRLHRPPPDCSSLRYQGYLGRFPSLCACAVSYTGGLPGVGGLALITMAASDWLNTNKLVNHGAPFWPTLINFWPYPKKRFPL